MRSATLRQTPAIAHHEPKVKAHAAFAQCGLMRRLNAFEHWDLLAANCSSLT